MSTAGLRLKKTVTGKNRKDTTEMVGSILNIHAKVRTMQQPNLGPSNRNLLGSWKRLPGSSLFAIAALLLT